MGNQAKVLTNLKWGRSPLSEDDKSGHFLAVGATGSGKTLILRTLLQSALSEVGKGKGVHGLVYDAKLDMMPILSSFVDRRLIKNFNPFDERGVAWKIHLDIDTPVKALQLTYNLVPERHSHSESFFENAVREHIWAVIVSFNLSGTEWTFADLFRVLSNVRLLKRVIRRHPQTEFVYSMYLTEPKLSKDIIASIAACCARYRQIAACWEHAKESISIRECIENEYVAILGNYEIARIAMQRINCVLSNCYTDQVLFLPEYNGNTFWVVFDELSEAGYMPHLIPFVKKSRSKGGVLLIAFQALPGLQSDRMYSQHGTDDLLGNISNRFIARIEDTTSARWLSDYIGEQDAEQISRTHSFGKGGSSETRSKANQKTILPSEFMSIPHCGPRAGLTGLFKLRSTDAFWDRLDANKLFNEVLLPAAKDVPAFIERPSAHQHLEPWTPEEIERYAPMPKRDRRRDGHEKPRENNLDDELRPPERDINDDDIDLSNFLN